MTDLAGLAAALAAHPHVTGKRDVDVARDGLGLSPDGPGRPGDDAAALPDGDGWALMATEGMQGAFVAAAPWFAGWCAVMVNLSDIAAMGGRATAVTDALWAPSAEAADPVLRGLRAAASAYGVPIVGGHTNLRAEGLQLAASVWGRARHLITSDGARPGDVLLAAVDRRGAYTGDGAYFPAFHDAPPARLRGDLAVLPGLAEDGLVTAGKDISQGGIAGTALMLAEASGVGIDLDPAALDPPDGDLARWMTSFPSFGFLLAVRPYAAGAVAARFAARDIAVGPVGHVVRGADLALTDGGDRRVVWDHGATPLMGFAPEAAHA